MTNIHAFDDTVLKAFRLAKQRKNLLVFTIFSCFLFLVSVFAWNHKVTESKAHLVQEYSNIDKIYSEELYSFQEQLKLNPNSALKEEDANFDTSMNQFYDFALKNSSSPYAWQAALRSGTYFISKEKYEKAATVLLAILPSTHRNTWIQVKARMALVGIYTQLNEQSKVTEQFNSLDKIKDNPIPDLVKLFKAQILLLNNQKDSSQKILLDILSNSNNVMQSSSSYSFKQSQLWQQYENQ